MKPLLQSGFITCVRDYVLSPSDVSEKDLCDLYKDFAANLENTVTERSVPYDTLRTVKYALFELGLVNGEVTRDNPVLAYYVRRAIAFLETELELLMLLIENPGLETLRQETAASPLYLSEEFTLTDLLELICSLWESGAARNRDGSRTNLKTITASFEWLFNVKFKDVHVLKHGMLNRLKIAPFLKKLIGFYTDLTAR